MVGFLQNFPRTGTFTTVPIGHGNSREVRRVGRSGYRNTKLFGTGSESCPGTRGWNVGIRGRTIEKIFLVRMSERRIRSTSRILSLFSRVLRFERGPAGDVFRGWTSNPRVRRGPGTVSRGGLCIQSLCLVHHITCTNDNLVLKMFVRTFYSVGHQNLRKTFSLP